MSQTPLWGGPMEDGITFSLLSKFLVCRERFRLKVIEGLDESMGFNHAIEFGSMWHEAEEAHAGGKPWRPAAQKYMDYLRSEHPAADIGIRKTYELVKLAFPLYVKHWQKKGKGIKRIPVLEEEVFNVPYELPSGRTIILKGKFDCVFRKKKSVWLQENKTKGRIDEAGLTATLDQNLQTMLYQIALRTAQKLGLFPFDKGDIGRIKGVLYNVVRRPLGDQHAIRQKKSETEKQFYQRVAAQIKADPNHYFMRWDVNLFPREIMQFQERVFDPIMEQLCDWWEWVSQNPFDPWSLQTSSEYANNIHWQAPWGIYNSMFGGFRGDYFEYLTTNKRSSLQKIDNLFPELEEH